MHRIMAEKKKELESEANAWLVIGLMFAVPLLYSALT